MTLTDRDLDKRTIRRNLQRGRLEETALVEAIEALPDVSDKIAPPASEEEEAAADEQQS